MTTTSRLGEVVSPGRDPGSLKTHKTPRLDEKSRSTRANFITISLRRTSLAWASVCVAQTQSSSTEREAHVATGFASLLISPRWAELVWARNADFYTDHALNSPQPCLIPTTRHTKQNSIIPNQFTQIATTHRHSIDSIKFHKFQVSHRSRICNV